MSADSPSPTSIYEVFEHQKSELLLHLLNASPDLNQVMVFVRTRDGVHAVTSELGRAEMSVESIHGQKKAELRDRALSAFNEGKIRVLVVTDAVARGLDITGVTNVINLDFPELHEDYQHRVACVESAGGEVMTMVTPKDGLLVGKLEDLLGTKIPRKIADEFVYASQPIKEKPTRKQGAKARGLRSKPLQNKKPKFTNKRGRK